MPSLLDNVKKEQIITQPYPHLVIEDALPATLYQQLLNEYPALTTINKGAQFASNQRFSLSAPDIINNPKISANWQELVRWHSSAEFFQQAIKLFDDHIKAIYPDFEKQIGTIKLLRTGIRNGDDREQVDVMLDAQICINTPVVAKPSSVRRVHVDLPNKLLVGLYYLRDSADSSTGGDLEICRFKYHHYRFNKASVDDRDIEVVKTIRYRANTLVMFINSIDSLHGVSVRAITPYPRYLFNLVVEVKKPLFNLANFQSSWWQRLKAFAPIS
jgi:hypothetical protein